MTRERAYPYGPGRTWWDGVIRGAQTIITESKIPSVGRPTAVDSWTVLTLVVTLLQRPRHGEAPPPDDAVPVWLHI